MSLNKVILQGRLTRDPEKKLMGASNIPCTKITIASEDMPSRNGEKPVNFIPCTAWNKTADALAKYFFKGKEILIAGRLRTYTWESNGVKTKGFEVVIDSIYFCGKREDDQHEASGAPEQGEGTSPGYSAMSETQVDNGSGFVKVEDDELPF